MCKCVLLSQVYGLIYADDDGDGDDVDDDDDDALLTVVSLQICTR